MNAELPIVQPSVELPSEDVPGAEMPGLDLDALTAHLADELPGTVAGPLRGRLIAGGRSNLTYAVSDDRNSWVLRRPPLGHVLETAHDMGREYRAMTALAATGVPVPRMLTQCADPAVLGAPFYMMSFVEGTVYRSEEQLAALDAPAAEALADRLVEALVELHRLDPADAGLADFGRPEGYLARQVRRWGKQLAASGSRQISGLEELGTRLAETVPETRRHGVVHGDYKLDNVVVSPEDGTIVAVLDWEMATLGDPLMDLVNLMLWWDGVLDTEGRPFAPVPARHPQFPPSSRLAQRYAELTGADLDTLPWCSGLLCYKLAAIFEGMHSRQTQGLTVGEGFELVAGLAPALAERGHRALLATGP
ncbi:acyl-CoA dehydrogenase [Nocardioides psychrotolerans]|uniref:Predicted kinase, aminoglycoside phosphotransferase (APT) family n=1 Tax=Nocardioides psychrotolerans TaxID=1005945 RepID=A0A1I3IPD7_9ACTN|nr:phosphotransferase family protein [Nocardioides psychrotolerans]GEP38085.1 acyl-CoA dehydrogenase [Nocardioides psychrotolerans]SFI49816.1 Predicted kinase, aminoglycoside phosphotransferase (APT) family [Nocardioides psychrotolerans]